MKCRRFLVVGASSVLLAVSVSYAGSPSFGKDGFGKNYGKEGPMVMDLAVEEVAPSRNRLGFLTTGGLGISAQTISDAFTKQSPDTPLSRSEDTDFALGGEAFFERLFSDPTATDLWGLRVGLGYSRIETDDRFTGIDVFDDPFTLTQDFNGDLVHLNVGPFYERRFTDRFYGQVSAGLTAAYMHADLETRHSAGLQADASDDEFLFGAYASVALGYHFSPDWSLMGGVRYQYLDSYAIDNGTSELELDFDSSVVFFAGLRWEF